MTENAVITMGGIADAHGIESFMLEEEAKKNGNILVLRAMANRQRHAVVYFADLDQKGVDAVNAMIRANDFINALKVLKVRAKEVRLADGMGNVHQSWDMIPNPKLDPWR
jgi:5S rRNA maturation endonuclease (ribonuclease M5)